MTDPLETIGYGKRLWSTKLRGPQVGRKGQKVLVYLPAPTMTAEEALQLASDLKRQAKDIGVG